MNTESISLPNKFSGYEIIEEIARGGMGIVYKARQKDIGRVVALKILLKEMGSDSKAVKRFLREARAISRLDHPNIIPLYQCELESNYPFFTMRYIEGKTFQRIIEDTEVSLLSKIEIFIQICQAMEHAHSKGIIHRDLKPANILIGDNNHPYVADFGLAHLHDNSAVLTRTGAVVGTVFYMSPEQMSGEVKRANEQMDVYSLGVILYQVLTGKLPFEAKTVTTLYQKVMRQDYILADKTNPYIPYAISAVCQKAMAKKKSDRYSSVTELIEDLENFLAKKKTSAEQFSWRKYAVLLPITLGLFALGMLLLDYKGTQKDEDSYLQKARVEVEHKQYFRALDSLNHYLFTHPSDLNAMMMQIEIIEKVNRHHELELLWEKIFLTTENLGVVKKITEQAFRLQKLAAICSLYQKFPRHFSSPTLQRQIAESLLFQNQLDASEKIYLNLLKEKPSNEIYLGLSFIAYHHFDSKRYQRKTLETYWNRLLLTSLNERKYIYYFLEAVRKWRKVESALNHWSWLLPNLPYRHDKVDLQVKLAEIKSDLDRAKKCLPATPDALQMEWQKYISWYMSALELEGNLKIDTALFKSQLDLMPTWEQVFFQKTLCRHYIRSKKWNEVQKITTKYSSEFPWLSEFHHFKAIALYHTKQLKAANNSIYLSIKANPFDYISRENFMSLSVEEFSQEQFVYFSRFIREMRDLEEEIFIEDLSNLQKSALAIPKVASLSTSQIEFYLNLLEKNRPESMKAMSRAILAKHFGDEKFQQLWRARLQQKKISEKEKQRFLQEAELFQKEQQQKNIKQVLLRYSALKQERYLTQIYQMPQYDELLLDIIRSSEEPPIMRWIAAKALIIFPTLKTTQILEESFSGKDVELQVLSLAILRTIRYPLFDKRWQKVLSYKLENKFFNKLVALTYPFNHGGETFRDFLKSENDPYRFLCGVLGYTRHASLEDFKIKVWWQKVGAFLDSPSVEVRILATRALSTMFAESMFKCPHAERNTQVFQMWKYYGNFVIQALTDSEEIVRYLTLVEVCKNYIFFYYFSDKSFWELPATKELHQYLKNISKNTKDRNTRTYALYALANIQDPAISWAFVLNSNSFFMERFRVFWGVSGHPYSFMRSGTSYMKFFSSPIKNVDDRSLKQMLMVGLGSAQGPDKQISTDIVHSTMRQFLKKAFDPKNPYLRQSYYASLLWVGTAKNIKLLLRALKKSKSVKEQKMIAASLAGLIMKFQSKSLPQLEKLLSHYDSSVKKAAAWGCHSLGNNVVLGPNWIQRTCHIETQLHSRISRLAEMQSLPEKQRVTVRRFFRAANLLYPTVESLLDEALVCSEPKESLALVQKAIKLTNTEEFLHDSEYKANFLKGACYMILTKDLANLKRFTKAREAAQKATKTFWLDNAFFLRGALELEKFDEKEAKKHFWQALMLGRNRCLFDLAAIDLRADRAHQAITLLQKFQPHYRFRRRDYLNSEILYKIHQNPWIQSLD